jgi:hypothetical protein
MIQHKWFITRSNACVLSIVNVPQVAADGNGGGGSNFKIMGIAAKSKTPANARARGDCEGTDSSDAHARCTALPVTDGSTLGDMMSEDEFKHSFRAARIAPLL